jgi:hypothetical protein
MKDEVAKPIVFGIIALVVLVLGYFAYTSFIATPGARPPTTDVPISPPPPPPPPGQ